MDEDRGRGDVVEQMRAERLSRERLVRRASLASLAVSIAGVVYLAITNRPEPELVGTSIFVLALLIVVIPAWRPPWTALGLAPGAMTTFQLASLLPLLTIVFPWVGGTTPGRQLGFFALLSSVLTGLAVLLWWSWVRRRNRDD